MWQRMSVDEYAEFNRALGVKVRKENGIWWQQQHPFFYRPLLPFTELSPRDRNGSLRGHGALQHAVPKGEPCNSYMNLVVYEQPDSYQLSGLAKNKRRRIGQAQQHLEIRPMLDQGEFIAQGFPVYLSFYERTRYSYKSDRRDPKIFAKWAGTLFRFPQLVILGAYGQHKLLEIDVSCLVEDTLFLMTTINSDEAMELRTGDLLLHTIREHAAKHERIKHIFSGYLAQKESLNRFKIERGARVLVKPAYLHLHRGLLSLIKLARRGLYDRLVGLSEAQVQAKMNIRIYKKSLPS